MALVAEADACLDSITPRQWPQCHRADASPSRILREGFAQLLDKWMRHPEHRIRLKCINRMGHLCNFLLDILCILGVHGMTFCIARLHSLSTFFVDYLRIDPHLDMDRMLQNRKGISAGYRMAGKYLAIIQPFSALSSNVKFRSRHAYKHATMLRIASRVGGMPDDGGHSSHHPLQHRVAGEHQLLCPHASNAPQCAFLAVVRQASRVGRAGRQVDSVHAQPLATRAQLSFSFSARPASARLATPCTLLHQVPGR